MNKTIYEVCQGSGLDSGRRGTIVNRRMLGRDVNKLLKEYEPGRYYPFDPKREELLLDGSGEYFTMFKNRLIQVDPETNKIIKNHGIRLID